MVTPYLRNKLIGNFNGRPFLYFIYNFLIKLPSTSLLDRLLNSYKIKCDKCDELLVYSTEYRSNWKWEIRKNYYNKSKYLKIDRDNCYYVAKEGLKNNRILCEHCFNQYGRCW